MFPIQRLVPFVEIIYIVSGSSCEIQFISLLFLSFYIESEKIPSIIPHENFFLPVQRDFCIDLGRDDAVMSHQFLHIADVGSVVQKLCGKAVPQVVGSGLRVDARQLPVFIKNFLDPIDAEPCAVFINEESGFRCGDIGPLLEPQVHLLTYDGRGDEEHPFFAAFSVNQNGTVFSAVVFQIQGLDLADSKAEAEEKLDDAHVPDGGPAAEVGGGILIGGGGCCDKGANLRFAEGFGKIAGNLEFS